MADKCISDPARDTIIRQLQKLDTCPEVSKPVIQRTPLGKAIFEGREYKSANYLAEHFPGGAYRETKEKEGPLKVFGQRTMTAVFEQAKFPDNTPFSHVYSVTKDKRKGLPVVIISNERLNPEYAPKPAKSTSKKATK